MNDDNSVEQTDSSQIPNEKKEQKDNQAAASALELAEVKERQESIDKVYNGPNKFKRHGLLSLFTLTLSLSISILLGTVTPLQSEPVSPSPSPQVSPSASKDCSVPADLCEQIKQQAKTDVEAEEKKRTEYVIKRFTSLHSDWKANLSAPALAKIELAIANTYELEYNKQDAIKKGDPQAALKKVFENGLWVPLLQRLQKAGDLVLISVAILLLYFVIWKISRLFEWRKRCLELVPVVDATEEKFGLHFPSVFALRLDKFRPYYRNSRLFSPGGTLPLIVGTQETKEMALLLASLSSAPPAKILEWFVTTRKPEYRVEISLQDNNGQIEIIYSLHCRNKSLLIEEQIFPKTHIHFKERDIAYKILMTITEDLEG